MPRFYSIIENENYKIGCTGQTVWVWDKNDTVLAKFKDLIYAYKALISPKGDIFAVKSVEGKLAVYSLETLSLIRKLRFSKVDSQDNGFCFSPDGKYFLNIECHGDSLHSALSVYDTDGFSLVFQKMMGEYIMLSEIQVVDGEYYVLGYTRREDGIYDRRFVAKFKDNMLCDAVQISESDYQFYCENIEQTLFGYKLSHRGFCEHTLARIWAYYRAKGQDLKLPEF